jgi:acetate kinase
MVGGPCWKFMLCALTICMCTIVWYFTVKRYGFHGTSVKFVASKAAGVLCSDGNKARDDLNLIVAHLGNGASVTAVKGGKVRCSL